MVSPRYIVQFERDVSPEAVKAIQEVWASWVASGGPEPFFIGPGVRIIDLEQGRMLNPPVREDIPLAPQGSILPVAVLSACSGFIVGILAALVAGSVT